MTPTPGPWAPYECSYYTDDKASTDWVCGISNNSNAFVVLPDGSEMDCTHTTLTRIDAELICELRNKNL